jgi:type IV pilus biogenesis protein CpaD/CtpE
MPNIQKIVVSGSAISQLSNDANYLLTVGDGILSGSAQIAAEISGAFTAVSGGLADRVNILETQGAANASTASYVSSDNVKYASNNGEQTATGVSSSISTRLTALEAPQTASFVPSDNVKFSVVNAGSSSLQTLTSVSSSASTRLTTLETDLNALEAKTLLSSSAQIAVEISGAFTEVSGGLADRVNILETQGAANASTASYVSSDNVKYASNNGEQTATGVSSSIAGRVTTLEGSGTIQGVGTTDNVTFASVTTTADVTVGGNLYVNGTTTAINSDNLNIEDKFILLNSGSAGSPSYEGGIIVESGSVAGTGNAFYYDASDNRWALKKGLSAGNSSAVTADAFMGMVLESAIGSVDTSSAYYKTGTIIVDNQDIYIVTV